MEIFSRNEIAWPFLKRDTKFVMDEEESWICLRIGDLRRATESTIITGRYQDLATSV